MAQDDGAIKTSQKPVRHVAVVRKVILVVLVWERLRNDDMDAMRYNSLESDLGGYFKIAAPRESHIITVSFHIFRRAFIHIENPTQGQYSVLLHGEAIIGSTVGRTGTNVDVLEGSKEMSGKSVEGAKTGI